METGQYHNPNPYLKTMVYKEHIELSFGARDMVWGVVANTAHFAWTKCCLLRVGPIGRDIYDGDTIAVLILSSFKVALRQVAVDQSAKLPQISFVWSESWWFGRSRCILLFSQSRISEGCLHFSGGRNASQVLFAARDNLGTTVSLRNASSAAQLSADQQSLILCLISPVAVGNILPGFAKVN